MMSAPPGSGQNTNCATDVPVAGSEAGDRRGNGDTSTRRRRPVGDGGFPMRACDACGESFEPTRASNRFCRRPTCVRVRKRTQKRTERQPRVVNLRPRMTDEGGEGSPLEQSVRAELTTAARLDSALGRQALHLADQLGLSGHTGSSVAAMHRELRAIMEAALATAERESPVDELRRRRAERLGRGA